jgi:hypothetical protein
MIKKELLGKFKELDFLIELFSESLIKRKRRSRDGRKKSYFKTGRHLFK